MPFHIAKFAQNELDIDTDSEEKMYKHPSYNDARERAAEEFFRKEL